MKADRDLHGTIWRDCNRRGRGHRWKVQQVIDGFTWWQCNDCPTITRTLDTVERPERVLL